ncbi:MAG: MMPL family transporter [Paludibacteraceae bacterium]|nr:MMPL family transporter [Paludibacteraceae bacterium]
MSITTKFHHTLLYLTLVLTVLAALMIPKVNVNSDMTKYLPDDSAMKVGVEVLQEEFDAGNLMPAGVKVMVHNLPADQKEVMGKELGALCGVEAVTTQLSTDGHYTLYNLQVPDSVNMLVLASEIRDQYDNQELVVETTQDGATPPVSVIVIAAVLVILILVVMGQSWLEPFIFLTSVGIAVLLNMGTNALLPSVSITTNYIGSILQLALSLDFSIVLMNRFRQELKEDRSTVSSMNRAIRRAARPILSSSLTTVVGLLMLCFMRLKIGMDMGIVLAKGVLCSLLCTFTVLPSLLIMMRRLIESTAKKAPLIPTNRLGRIATGHKVTMALLGVVILGASYYFSRQTPITFSTKRDSQIERIFPVPNAFVMLYNTPIDDVAAKENVEQAVINLAGELESCPEVKAVLSYPSLLKNEQTADQAVDYLSSIATRFSDFLPASADSTVSMGVDMLTPETMRIVYYLHSGAADTIRLTFTQLMRFLADEVLNDTTNTMLAGQITPQMRGQVDLLKELLADDQSTTFVKAVKRPQRPAKTKVASHLPTQHAEAKTSANSVDGAVSNIRTTVASSSEFNTTSSSVVTGSEAETTPTVVDSLISVNFFMPILAEQEPSDVSAYLRNITDTVLLMTPMTVNEMAAFIGSSVTQTRTSYSIGKCGKAISPYAYVHMLLDDLFQRKNLRAMVSNDQVAVVTRIGQFMDLAFEETPLSAGQMAVLLQGHGLTYMTAEHVKALAFPMVMPVVQPEVQSAEIAFVSDTTLTSLDSLRMVAGNLMPSLPAIPAVHLAAQPVEQPLKPKPQPATYMAPKPVKPSKEEQMAATFMELKDSRRPLSAEQMAKAFSRLGQKISPTQVHLIYTLYGTKRYYNDSLTMTTERLLYFVTDTLAVDPALAPFLPTDMAQSLQSAREALASGMSMMTTPTHGLCVVMTDLPDESEQTYQFVDYLKQLADQKLVAGYAIIGQSAMYNEMRDGFGRETSVVTLLTILAIFLIVAVSFRSLVIPTILITTVLSAVWVNVIFAGVNNNGMLYLAYLIVQSILMGATIDYGILFTNYYKEFRKQMPKYEACLAAYRGSIPTIMTSGLIMVAAPGVMALLVDDITISSILGCIGIGAGMAIILILVVLPAVIVALDRWVVRRKKTYEYQSQG